ncbi:hypothetical protein TCAL_15613, partial [Tigriopus californicus]
SKYPLEFQREKRLFSLFNIVQFRNDPCQALSSSITGGTCLSAQECSSQGGTMDGNCAAGFGVCCIFAVIGCSGIVTKNCTYVRIFAKSGKIYRDFTILTAVLTTQFIFRLDFGSITMIPLGTLPGECGGTGDALTVRSPHSGSQSAFPPPVCGTLTGQHRFCSVQFKETDIATPDPFDLDAGNPDQVQDNCMSKNHVTIPSRAIDVVVAAITASQDVGCLLDKFKKSEAFYADLQGIQGRAQHI